jgi:Rod binding domain-containing protein
MTSTPGSSILSQLSTLGGTPAPSKTTNVDKAREQAREFESVFLSNVLAQMFGTLEKGEGPLGAGSDGGETWRSFLTDEYAGEIAKNGGVGIADQVMRELISVQEQSE